MFGLAVWIIIVVVTIGFDIVTKDIFYTGFAFGAIAAVLVGLAHIGFVTQLIVFLSVSIISVYVLHAFIRSKIRVSIPKYSNSRETLIGKVYTAEELINSSARVKLLGSFWRVINKGNPIMAGEKFMITEFEGNALIIAKADETLIVKAADNNINNDKK